MPCCRLRHRVRVPALRGNGAAEPVLVDIKVRAPGIAYLASRVGAAAGSLSPTAPVGRFWLARADGAGDEASGGDDEGGGVLGSLAGDLASQKALELAPKDQRNTLKSQLDQAKKASPAAAAPSATPTPTATPKKKK